MRDLLPEWIADYEHFQEMTLEMSAEIDLFLEKHPMNTDVEEMQNFLSERYCTLQEHIDELRVAEQSGSKVLLVGEDGEEDAANERCVAMLQELGELKQEEAT